MDIHWDEEKNIYLLRTRNIDFEYVKQCIIAGTVLDTLEHHNKEKYPTQKLFVIQRDKYIYYVPFIEKDDTIFLKSIIPSRKLTKKYINP